MEYKGFRVYSESETEEMKRRYFETVVNRTIDDESFIWTHDNIRLAFIEMLMGTSVQIIHYKLAVEFETYHKDRFDYRFNCLMNYKKTNCKDFDEKECIGAIREEAQEFADEWLNDRKMETPEWMLQKGYVLVTHNITKLRDDESFVQFLNSILTSGNNIEKSLNNLDENGKPLRIFQGMCTTGYDYELTKVVNKEDIVENK